MKVEAKRKRYWDESKDSTRVSSYDGLCEVITKPKLVVVASNTLFFEPGLTDHKIGAHSRMSAHDQAKTLTYMK
jgi:hypothetical protein